MRWYNRLTDESTGLLAYGYSRENIILRYSPGMNKPNKFCVFDSFREFISFYAKTPTKCFHEIILADKAQKPRFDIDHYDYQSGSKILKCLIRSIIEVITKLGYNISAKNNIVITTSHAQDKSKYSAHVIVNGLYVSNNKKAKHIYNLVIARMSEDESVANMDIRTIVDSNIYKKVQGFRLLLSAKSLTDRRQKVLCSYKYGNELINYKSNMPNSLFNHMFKTMITMVAGCTEINIDVPDYELSSPIIESDILEVVSRFNCILEDFVYSSKSKNRIVMKRLRPSYCCICDRIHENMHQTIFLDVNLGYVAYCGRSLDHIGYVCYIILTPPDPYSVIMDIEDLIEQEQSTLVNESTQKQEQSTPVNRPEEVNITALNIITSKKPDNKHSTNRVAMMSMM